MTIFVKTTCFLFHYFAYFQRLLKYVARMKHLKYRRRN